jgi:hypothetical protein
MACSRGDPKSRTPAIDTTPFCYRVREYSAAGAILDAILKRLEAEAKCHGNAVQRH